MTGIQPNAILRAIATFFESHTGQRLGESRLWRIEAALRTVMRDHGFAGLSELLRELRRDPDGPVTAATLHCIMNHESSFFRDLNVFQMLEKEVLPHLNRTLPEKLLRIWCAGCSTGQETYSLAIAIKRQADMWKDWRVSILGTDVSPFAVQKAQAGVYQQMDVQRGLPISDLLKYFESTDEQWRVSSDIRRMVSFKTDNLLAPRAVTGFFDLVLCRNVLLYFAPGSRAQALGVIAKHTRKDSMLILGAGETTIGASNLFVPAPGYRGIYQPASHASSMLHSSRLAG